MTSASDFGAGGWLALAAGAVLLALIAWTLVLARRLRAQQAETRRLAGLVDDLRRTTSSQAATPARERPRAETDFVITEMGSEIARHRDEVPVPTYHPATGREFASVAVGESLVRVFALGHGVRRALSAETRNRIAFEMRRETKRSRRQRRRDLKAARRQVHEAERGTLRQEDAA